MKKKFGDRRDASLIKNLDSMHFIMPHIYPNRCDNEAFVSERIDLTRLGAYLEQKNSANPEYKYNLFQAIVTALLKTITLRPKMNRFIANKKFYQRNEISAAFIIKKIFSDKGEEGMAFIHSKPADNINTIHDEIYRQVSHCRSGDEKNDSTEKSMDLFNRLPGFISRIILGILCILDRHGRIPEPIIKTDPFYSSVVLSNLGSIKLRSGYHHLTNWGTTSLFVVIGERKLRPFYDDYGNIDMRDSVDIGLTVDERIADGYYFSKTIRLFKKLLENPELLEGPLGEGVDI